MNRHFGRKSFRTNFYPKITFLQTKNLSHSYVCTSWILWYEYVSHQYLEVILRVSRLGEFSPIGRLITVCFLSIKKVAQILATFLPWQF
jgi:hypothetical protein